MSNASHPLFGSYQKKRTAWEQRLQQETYTVAEAAKVLRLSERKVRCFVNEGKIIAASTGGKRGTIIPKQAIVDYLVPSPFDFFGENF